MKKLRILDGKFMSLSCHIGGQSQHVTHGHLQADVHGVEGYVRCRKAVLHRHAQPWDGHLQGEHACVVAITYHLYFVLLNAPQRSNCNFIECAYVCVSSFVFFIWVLCVMHLHDIYKTRSKHFLKNWALNSKGKGDGSPWS